MTDPAYVQLDDGPFTPRLLGPDLVTGRDQPAADALEESAVWQEERMNLEADVRRAHLETAVSTAVQLKVMERIEGVVAKAATRGWYDWAVLGLAAIAAIASVVAIFVALKLTPWSSIAKNVALT